MINNEEILRAVEMLEEQKQIKPEVAYEAIKEALIKAYHKVVDPAARVEVDINPKTGEIKLFNIKTIVKTDAEIEDDMTQLTEAQIKEIDDTLKAGDEYREEYNFSTEFTRQGASFVAQSLKQNLREITKKNIFNEYSELIGEIKMAQVEAVVRSGAILKINGINAFLPQKEMINEDNINPGDNIKVAISKVHEEGKGAQIVVTRRSPNFVIEALKQEIPEIADGVISIKWVQREPGMKSKVVVESNDSSLDPIGACVGKGGERIKFVEKQLPNGERVEIAEFSEDLIQLLKSIFSPAPLISVDVNENKIDVIVPDDKYSLALSARAIAGKLASTILGKRVWIHKLSEIKDKEVENLDNCDYVLPVAQVKHKRIKEEEVIFASEEIAEPTPEFTDLEKGISKPNEIKDEFEYKFEDAKADVVIEEEYSEEVAHQEDYDKVEEEDAPSIEEAIAEDEEFDKYDDESYYD